MMSPVARLALPYFPTLSYQVHDLIPQIFEHKMCFDFFYNVVKDISHSKKFREIILKMCIGLHVKYTSFLLNLISWRDFRKDSWKSVE